MSWSRRYFAGFLLALSSVGIPTLTAGPVDLRTIVSGHLTIEGAFGPPAFALRGTGVDSEGRFEDGAFGPQQCTPCPAGALMPLDARISASSSRGPLHTTALDLTFTAPSVSMPVDGSPEATIVVPFSFVGRLIQSTDVDPPPVDIVRDTALGGAGLATARFTSIVDPATNTRLYFLQRLSYVFAPATRMGGSR